MSITCHKCGIQTEAPEAFFKVRKSFRRSVLNFCPKCHAEKQLSGLKRQALWTIVTGGCGLALALLFPETSFGWILLNLFCFDLSLIATIVPHEFGHAFVARWLGQRVFRVAIGSGGTLVRRKIFGFDTEFKAVPLGGVTVMAPVEKNWARSKQFASVLAGPFVNFQLCLGILWIYPIHQIWDFDRLSTGLAPVQVFFFANLMVLLTNLWPGRVNTSMGKLSTDGRQLLETFFLKDEKINEWLAGRYVLEAMDHYEKGQLDEAGPWVERGLRCFPGDLNLQNTRGLLLLETKHYQSARKVLSEVLARDEIDPTMRGILLNNIAYADFCQDAPELMDEADRFSQEAIALLGWIPAVKGTRGSVLLGLGRTEEALPLLYDAMENADTTSGKAQNACWISIGETRMGNLDEGMKYLEEARRLAPDCIVLDKTEAAVREASPSS